MKRIWLATTLMLCGLAQALFVGQVARAEDEASGAKLLPKDTLLFVSVPSIPDSNEEFEKSLTGAMFHDPELKPFLDDVQKKIDELSEKLQQEIGVSINDLLEIPQGELTFAVVERPARKLAPILIVDYGDKKETVDKLLKKLHEGLEGDIAEHSVEEVDDIKVHVYTFKNSDPDNPFKTLAYFCEDSTLVFSTEVAALKEVLDRWDGEGSDTLADNDIYKYIQDRCKEESGEPDLVWYLSPIGLIQSGLNMAQSVVPQAGVAAIFLPTLGIDRLKGWGGASFTGVGEYDSISKAFVFSEQPKGVLEVFLFPATDLAPPKWVSADTSVYFGGNWNIPQAYTAIETMIDGFQGRGFTAKQLDRAADGGPGIHPKKDVIDLLDGKFHMVQGFEENEDGVPTQQFLIAFDVKDAAKMKKTLAKAAKAGEGQVETREFNGETIYEVSAGGDQVISLAVAAGHFVVTNDTPTLEGMLRTDSQGSLADSPAYKKVAKHFPAKVSMISYSRSDSQLKALYEMLKGLDNSEFIEGIDLQKLPPFETLQKYLRPSGSFTVPDKKGALTVGFQLREGDK